MHFYTKTLNTFETTEYTTTYKISTFVQVKEDTRKGIVMHRYGRVIHSHYDTSLLGFPARWINERVRYYEWRTGYPM